MGAEMTVAAPAMAIIIVEPKNLSRMIGLLCLAVSHFQPGFLHAPELGLMVAIFGV
jgi:hypothetical protein